MRRIPFEPEAVCNAASIPPLIFQMPLEKGREDLEKMQALTAPGGGCVRKLDQEKK